jgi:hypothetical protein
LASKLAGHKKKENRRTKQFRACDIIIYDANNEIIPNTAPLHILYTATVAVMRITNQKNGTRGSRISHTTSGTKACPVKALARRVHYIMDHPDCTETDIISTYYSTRTRTARPLQAGDINTLIKSAVSLLGLDKKGFPPDAFSSHSLRAGGAMAMHLNNIDRDKIRKQGRWSSNTFLMYIHEHRWTNAHGTSPRGLNSFITLTSPFYVLLCAFSRWCISPLCALHGFARHWTRTRAGSPSNPSNTHTSFL